MSDKSLKDVKEIFIFDDYINFGSPRDEDDKNTNNISH